MTQTIATSLLDVVAVDLTRAPAGPQASMILAELGARAIKVEGVEGDESRGWGPPSLGKELPGPVGRFGDNDHAGGRASDAAPPPLGQHNDAVRSWVGLNNPSVKEVNA